jgi:hypothetical protein
MFLHHFLDINLEEKHSSYLWSLKFWGLKYFVQKKKKKKNSGSLPLAQLYFSESQSRAFALCFLELQLCFP